MFRIEVQAVANFSLFTIHFSLNERNGVSLSASRRFAVSDTACCSFLTMQRYKIFRCKTSLPEFYLGFISNVKICPDKRLTGVSTYRLTIRISILHPTTSIFIFIYYIYYNIYNI